MGEGIVDWRGFTFEANCGSCGGTSPPPDMVRTPGIAVGLAHCCLGGGTIPEDWFVGIQGELIFWGGTPGLWPEAHQHGCSGAYPNRRVWLTPVPLQPC